MMIQKVKGKGSARGIFVASILMMTFFMGMIPAAVTADIVDTPFEAYATITPNIDGVISGSEWSDAAIATQTITHSAEYVQELTVAIKNDATYLYMLVQITNEDYSEAGSGADFINILFDNDNDGAIDTGENRWAIRYDGTSVVDAFNPNGVAHHSQKDTTDGGTDDLFGAISHSNPVPNGLGTYIAEFAGLLDSGDTGHDFALAPGDTVGFAVNMADSQAPGGFYIPSTVPWVGAGWAEIVATSQEGRGIAVSSLAIDSNPLVVGEMATSTVVVENTGDFTETFTMTLNYGTIPILTHTVVDLAPGDTKTLIDTWPTHISYYNEAAIGHNHLVAQVTGIPNEPDVSDNTLVLTVDVIEGITEDISADIELPSGINIGLADGVTLTGDVYVNGGNLILTEGAKIVGNILGTEGGDITIREGSQVTGDIIHTGGTMIISDGSIIDGNGIRAGSLGTHITSGSIIKGNFEGIDSPIVTIQDSTIGGSCSYSGGDLTGEKFQWQIEQSIVGNGLVIDVPSSGVALETLDILVDKSTITSGLVIDVPSSGVALRSLDVLVDETTVTNSLVIDVTSAGLQGEARESDSFSLAVDNSAVVNDLVIDVTSAGIYATDVSMGVSKSIVGDDLNYLGADAEMGVGQSPFIVGECVIGGNVKAVGSELVSGFGESPFIVADTQISGNLGTQELTVDLLRSTVSGSLYLSGPQEVMGVEPSPFRLESSQIGGSVFAEGPEAVMGVDPTPFRVVASTIGGDQVIESLHLEMQDSFVVGNLNYYGTGIESGVGQSPFIVAGSEVGGSVLAIDPNIYMGVEPSPFRISDTTVGGSLETFTRGMELTGSTVTGGLNLNPGETVMGVEPSPFKSFDTGTLTGVVPSPFDYLVLSNNILMSDVIITEPVELTITGNEIYGDISIISKKGTVELTMADNIFGGNVRVRYQEVNLDLKIVGTDSETWNHDFNIPSELLPILDTLLDDINENTVGDLVEFVVKINFKYGKIQNYETSVNLGSLSDYQYELLADLGETALSAADATDTSHGYIRIIGSA